MGEGCQAQAAQAEPLSLSAFPPMPVPPAGFAGLTPEELRALEGHERQHLEARLQSLRNIHTLLDAAMLQINQYLTVLASLGYVCTGAMADSRAWGCREGPQQGVLVVSSATLWYLLTQATSL